MKTVGILILGLSAIFADPSSSSPQGCRSDKLCIDRAAGRYPYPHSTYFYTCTSSGVNLGCQKCGAENLYYSKECDACLSKVDVVAKNCPKVDPGSGKPDECAPTSFCIGRQNKIYQSPNNKQKFFNCEDGTASLCQKCPVSLLYSEVCGQCLRTDIKNERNCPNYGQTTTTPLQCSPELCHDRLNGDYEGAENSKNYYTCAEGTCYVRACPTGSVFVSACNNRCEVAYIKNKEDCPNNPEKPTKKPKVCTPVTFCVDKADGNYQKIPNKKEHTYYQCAHSNCYVQKCSSNLVYNPAGNCDFASNF